MKENKKGVIGVIADIYMGVIQNLLNFSVNLCCIVINRIIFNLIGFHLEQIIEENEKCDRHSRKVRMDLMYFIFSASNMLHNNSTLACTKCGRILFTSDIFSTCFKMSKTSSAHLGFLCIDITGKRNSDK